MIYNLDYFEKMLRQNSATAQEIAEKRWRFILDSSCNQEIKTVLDYGSGVGWFRAFRPENIRTVHTFDIGKYPQTGISLMVYDVVTFWDVLEHIKDFRDIEPILRLANNVACSLPMLPKEKDILKWKHFKPGEHLHYFSKPMLVTLMAKYGFKWQQCESIECPPRQDILSFYFTKFGGITHDRTKEDYPIPGPESRGYPDDDKAPG
jgi:hypothetical protein